MKDITQLYLLLSVMICLTVCQTQILANQTDVIVVNSLVELQTAVQLSNQEIVMTPGDYNFEDDLDDNSRYINCSGSYNTITLTGVYINVPVGCVDSVYFVISGDNNSLIGGEIEDTYRNGITEITDFSAYNQDRTNLAHGLRGAPVLRISGSNNVLTGFKLTTRGSFPYGYGSMYGIGAPNVFGLDKRCGILIKGNNNTLDSVEVQQRAFGHGIYMQSGADGNLIKNTHVEGRVRETIEFYSDNNTYDLPYLTDFKLPFSDDNEPIPSDEVYSLCEDGIRMYNNTGSITVENCTVEKMRGGIRLYLGESANVSNSTAIDCGNTNYNMPNDGIITNSSGNFNYSPLSDFRLSRNHTDIEWTVIPSPDAIGPHNLADVQGSNHKIVFHRTEGPLDNNTSRAIVITDDYSTIVNETEYPIVLESTASGNNITSCGPVYNYGSGNTIKLTDCAPFGASDIIEAENYISMFGVESSTTSDEGDGKKVSAIDVDDWMEYEVKISDAGTYWLDYRISGASGDFILELNDESVDTLTFSPTGNDETWQTVRSNTAVFFTEGTNTLRINSRLKGWNLNWIQLLPDCYNTDIELYVNTSDLFGTESEEGQISEFTVFPGSTVELTPTYVYGGTWAWSGPNEFTSSQREISLSNIQKNHGGIYEVTLTNNCGQVSTDSFELNVSDSLVIEAEEYRSMSGITVEATTDITADSMVSSINAGDWIEFEIDIPFSALYTIDYRVASESNNGTFTTCIDGDSIDQVSFSPQNWGTESSSSSVYLKAGVHTLLLTSKSSGWRINWIKLIASETVKECSLPFINTGFIISNEVLDWTSGQLDISCENELDIHFVISSSGDMANSDYINIYYKLDGGDTVSIAEKTNAVDEMMVSARAVSGTMVELIVQSETGNAGTSYHISKIIINTESDPFARIEAEEYDEKSGTLTKDCSDTDGGQNIGSIIDGNWLMFRGMNLNEVSSISARLAHKNSSEGTIEVRLDSKTGDLIGTINVPNTGNWQSWETVKAKIEPTIGFYDVFLVFNHPSYYVGNINWFQFSSEILPNSEATVTSPVYTVIQWAKTITNVPQGTSLSTFENNLIPAVGATFTTYQSDGTSKATELSAGCKVIVTAEDGVTTDTYTVKIATSLVNVISYDKVLIYPNPFNDYLTIKNNANTIVEIFNTSGQKVFEDVVEGNMFSISTASFPPGIYTVKLISKDSIKSGKFLKR